MMQLADEIKAKAQALGFDMCGIAEATPSVFKAEFHAWLEKGYAADMAYMARDPERRLDPQIVMPGAKSIVVVAMNYYTESDADTADPERAVFARYARNEDYHDVMTARLRELLAFVRERAGEGAEGRVYVDAGPILEREVAQRAGIGWFGKSTMLIAPKRGTYFVLGELLLNIALTPDDPAVGNCGACTRCMDACPTGAIVAPYVVDARRCLSYLTIEHRREIPAEFASKIGNRIFGCDICQEVCPFNRFAAPTAEPAFQPREATRGPRLVDLLAMDDDAFRAAFRKSPVKRAKRAGLQRNVRGGILPAEAAKGFSHEAVTSVANEAAGTHSTDRVDFTEIEDMIFAVSAHVAHANLAILRPKSYTPWQCERLINRICVDAGWTELTPKERIREELKLAVRYEQALAQQYPRKRFVLSHLLGHYLSFYQAAADAPIIDIPPTRRDEKVWCVKCHRQQAYKPRSEPDLEFPKAEWGECVVCGDEVLVASWEVLRLIGPAL